MKKSAGTLIELVTKLADDLSIEEREKLAIEEIPELQDLKDTICHHPYHKYEDILEHSLESLKLVSDYVTDEDNYSECDIALLRIILLLHDAGKATTKTTGNDGVDHFYGHPKESVRIAEKILNRYNIDEKDKKIIYDIIELHDNYIPHDNDEGLKKVINKIGLKETGMLLKVQRADLNTHSDIYASRVNPMLDALSNIYNNIKGKSRLIS